MELEKKKMYSESRVDIDVCANKVGNRFDLVLLAAQRTRELRRGAQKMVPDHNSATVTALKEIEAGFIRREHLSVTKKEKQRYDR